MVAMGILAVVLYLTFRILMSSQTTYNEASIAQSLETRSRSFIDHYKKEMMFCRIRNIAGDGSSIRYQVQLTQYDLSGNLTNAALDYGAVLNGNQSNWEYELAFVPTRFYRESSAAPTPPSAGVPVEILEGIDVNSDGDITDTYAQGRIEQRAYDSLGVFVEAAGTADFVILGCNTGLMSDDINNDGLQDMLFTVVDSSGNPVTAAQIAASGVKLRLNVWHGDFNETRTRFVLRNLGDEWNFRNDQ